MDYVSFIAITITKFLFCLSQLINIDTINLKTQGAGIFNGEEHILYYADATTEVAFIVPHLPPSVDSSHLNDADAPTTPELTDAKLPQSSSGDKTKMSLDLIAGNTTVVLTPVSCIH